MNYRTTTRHATPSTAFPLRAMHLRFLSKGSAFFPEKMGLELTEDMQVDREG